MSSKYADKQSHPDCSAECDAPGTRLALIAQRPHWLCQQHYDEYTTTKKANPS